MKVSIPNGAAPTLKLPSRYNVGDHEAPCASINIASVAVRGIRGVIEPKLDGRGVITNTGLM